MNIPELVEFLKGKTIAVVGGAPIKDKGKEIDAHDIVIRFNFALTKGYEIDRGSKLDIQVVGGNSLFEYYRVKPQCKTLVCFYYKDKTESLINIGKQFYRNTVIATGLRRPTTGFFLLYFLRKYSIKADAYGFNFYKTRNYDRDFLEQQLKKYHPTKYEPIAKMSWEKFVEKIIHEPDKEKRFWKKYKWHNFIK